MTRQYSYQLLAEPGQRARMRGVGKSRLAMLKLAITGCVVLMAAHVPAFADPDHESDQSSAQNGNVVGGLGGSGQPRNVDQWDEPANGSGTSWPTVRAGIKDYDNDDVVADEKIAQSSQARQRDEDDAFDEAVTFYKTGQADKSQSAFESFVARFPQSRNAPMARRYLAKLYRNLDDEGEVSRAEETPRGGSKRPQIARRGTSAHKGDAKVPTADGLKLGKAAATPKRTIVPPGMAVDALANMKQDVSENLSEKLRNAVGDRVFFSEGSAELGGRARLVLKAQANFLATMPNARILISGHADDPGGDNENRSLSTERAWAVHKRLTEEGVDPKRLMHAGAGRADPISLCKENACAAHNRRTVIYIIRPRVTGSRKAPDDTRRNDRLRAPYLWR